MASYLNPLEFAIKEAIVKHAGDGESFTVDVTAGLRLMNQLRCDGVNCIFTYDLAPRTSQIRWLTHTDPEAGGTTYRWATITIPKHMVQSINTWIVEQGVDLVRYCKPVKEGHLKLDAGDNNSKWASEFRYYELPLTNYVRWYRIKRCIIKSLPNLRKHLEKDIVAIQGCYKQLKLNPLQALRTKWLALEFEFIAAVFGNQPIKRREQGYWHSSRFYPNEFAFYIEIRDPMYVDRYIGSVVVRQKKISMDALNELRKNCSN